MKIVADGTGRITSWGTDARIPGPDFTNPIPDDFEAMQPYGKYKLDGGLVVPVAGWVMPTIQSGDMYDGPPTP